MSLLNGLKEAMLNPMFEAVNESDIDAELDFEMAMEAVVDKHIELSDADIAAIMDDNNPDNVVADIGANDESIKKITEDAFEDDLASLESMLDEFLASESVMIPDDPNSDADPESTEGCKSTEGCGSKATEMDDEDGDDDNDDYLSLDSLLKSIF